MTSGDRPGRAELMEAALVGLSVGDAFGDQFFLASNRSLVADDDPPGPWKWSDDTELACSVVDVLRRHARIDQDALATAFAARFDPGRPAKQRCRPRSPTPTSRESPERSRWPSPPWCGCRVPACSTRHCSTRRGPTCGGAWRLSGATVQEAAWTLGNGSRITAQDTVPFALWVASRFAALLA